MLIPDCVHLKGITGILHCGAHLAEEAESYANAGHEHVLWIEGDATLIDKLTDNVKLYKNNHVAHAMLWSKSMELCFHRMNNTPSSSLLELGTHATHYPGIVEVNRNTVMATTIDDILGEGYVWNHLNFWNLDLQGAELHALIGGEHALQYCDYLYTEVNFEEVYKGCPLIGELDKWLSERGFVRLLAVQTGMGWGDALYVRKNK